MFGPKGVDGKRMGGIISRGVMDWVREHKVALLGGATFGAVKGIIGSVMPAVGGPLGFMGSWLLPGGPITGALMGAAIGIGWKSKTFQEFLYGKEDATGKKMGGILNTQMGSAMKKHLPNAVVGAIGFGGAAALIGQMGWLGAMLTPMGPIGAAVLGAAAGIGISSEKFKNFLFGKKDEKTGLSDGGLWGQVKNFFTIQFSEPFKLWMQRTSENIRFWFVDKISVPFKAALGPFQTQMKLFAKDIQTMFKNGWKYLMKSLDNIFERAVGAPLAKFMAEKVVDPMKRFMNKLVNGIGKVFGFILSSPIKAMHFMATSFVEGQTRRGIKEARDERNTAFFGAIKGLGSSIAGAISGNKKNEDGSDRKSIFDSLKDVFGTGKDLVKGRVTNEGKTRYVDEEKWKADEQKLHDEAKAEHDRRIAEFNKKLEENRQRAKMANKANYKNTMKDSDGNVVDVSAIYNLEVPLTDIDDRVMESNSWLSKIANLAGSIAAVITGNPKAQDYAAKPNKPGSAAETPKIPSELKPDSADQKAMKAKKTRDQRLAEMAERRGREMDRNAALGDDVIYAGAGEQAGAISDNQNATDNGNGTVTTGKGGRFSLHNMLGRGIKFKFGSDTDFSKFIDMLPGQGQLSPEAYAKMQATVDRLMNRYLSRDQKDKKKTEEAATQMQASGAVAANQPGATGNITPQQIAQQQKQARAQENAAGTVDSNEDRKFDSKNGIGKGGGIDKAIKYLRIIASNVDGQLDGVGSNVYKTRKILESITGVSGDNVGSGNRDRTTWMGRFGRIFKMMIFNPMAFIGEIISKPFEVVASVGKKIYDTMWNIVDGVGSMITKAGNMIFETGKAVVETVMKVPKLAIDIIGGVAEVVAETAKAGVRVIGEGLVGITQATFKIVTGAGKAIGSILNGLGKGVQYLFEGIGVAGKAVFEGIGKALSLSVEVAGSVAKGVVEIGTALTSAVTKVATEGITQVGKLATKLIGGVADLITSAAGSLFSIVSSPFKFIGNLGKSLIQRSSHVIVDGGKIESVDNVKVVELVRKVEQIGGKSPIKPESQNIPGGTPSLPGGSNAPGAPAANQETPEEKESRKEKEARKNKIAEGKAESKEAGEEKEEKKEQPGKPANVTADMAKSGLADAADGTMQRTAQNMKAVAEINAERKFMQDIESREANALDVLVAQGKERKGFWDKFWKWLMLGLGFLKGLLGNILSAIGGIKLGNVLGNALKGLKDTIGKAVERAMNGLKDKIAKLLPKDLLSGLKGKIAEGVREALGRFFKPLGKEAAEEAGEKAIQKGIQKGSTRAAEDAAERYIERKALGAGGQKAAGEVAEDVGERLLLSGGEKAAGTVAEEPVEVAMRKYIDNSMKQGLKPNVDFLKAAQAETQTLGRNMTESEAMRFADKYIRSGGQIFVGDASQAVTERGVSTVVSKGAQEAGTVATEQVAKETVDVVASDASKKVPWVQKLLVEAINVIEKAVNKATGKNFSIAGGLKDAIFKHVTPDFIVRNMGKILPAAAKGTAGTTADAATAGMAEIVMAAINAPIGMYDAAHMFEIDEKAVTATMRVCAAVSKCVFGMLFIGMCILDVVLHILGEMLGFDHQGWLARLIYSLITDTQAAMDLEAEQAKFKQQAIDAGYTKTDSEGNVEADVKAYNDEVNKTLWNKTVDTVKAGKNWVGESWRNTFGYTDTEGVEHQGWIGKGWDNNMAWLFGQNDENGNYQNGVFANMKDFIFGTEDENGNTVGGFRENIQNYLYDKFVNTVDWFFGVKPGATDNLITKFSNELDNTLAWIFGQNDENGHYVEGIIAKTWREEVSEPVAKIGKGIAENWELTKADLSKRIDNNLVYLFGGTDPYTGEERRGKIGEFYDYAIKPWLDPLKEKVIDPIGRQIDMLAENIHTAMDTLGRFWNSITEKFSNFKKNYINPVLVGIFGESDYYSLDKDGNKVLTKGKKGFFGELVDNLSTRFNNWIDDCVYGFRKWWHDAAVSVFGAEYVGEFVDPRDQSRFTGSVSAMNQMGQTDTNDKLVQSAGFSGGGIADSDYLQTNYAGVSYGNMPGMGDFAKAGCAPSVMSKIMNESTGSNVSPTDMGELALTMGERVPGGTAESFFSDVGGSHLDSFNDVIRAAASGQKVALGGKGSSYISSATDAGHYMELEGINGNKATVFDPLKGRRDISLDSLARQTETAYSFAGSGIGDDVIDALQFPDMSSVDKSSGLIPAYISEYGKWFIESGGPLGITAKIFKAGLKSLANWVFGGIDGADPNYIYTLVTKQMPETLGGFFKSMKEGLQKKWEDVKGWLFSDSNLSKESIFDTFKSGLKWATDKLKGSGTGDNLNRIASGKFYGGGFKRKFRGSGSEGLSSPDSPLDPQAPKNMPFFRQWDPRWGDSPYYYNSNIGGSNTFTMSACGPTSMAMIATWATGKPILPTEAASFASANEMHESDGTSYSFFDAFAKTLGFSMEQTGDRGAALAALQNKLPVISVQDGSGGNSPFTKGGHFIVLAGMRDDGSIIVYDPNRRDPGEGFTPDEVFNTSYLNWIPSGSGLGSGTLDVGGVTSGGTASSPGAAQQPQRPKGFIELASSALSGVFDAFNSSLTSGALKNKSNSEKEGQFKGKGKFRGAGNTMYMPQQSTNKNCTLTATAALINAYTGSNKTSDDYDFGGVNWWWPAVTGMPAADKEFTQGQESEFNSTLENHFNAHPEWPVFLYQTGGAGSGGSHPLNRGGGSHATVIGRKLSDGTYEVYDSNGGMIHKLGLSQIFDPTASGAQGMDAGNALLIPQQGPNEPIDTWKADGGTSNEVGGTAKDNASGGNASAKSQSNKPRSLMDIMTGTFNNIFDAVNVGATGKIWSPNMSDNSNSSGASGSSFQSGTPTGENVALGNTGNATDDAGILMSSMARSQFGTQVPQWFWRTILRSESTGPNGPMTSPVALSHNNFGGLKYASWLEKYGGSVGDVSPEGDNYAMFPDKESGLKAEVEWFLRPDTYDFYKTEIAQAQAGDRQGAMDTHVMYYVQGRLTESVIPGISEDSIYGTVSKEEFPRGDLGSGSGFGDKFVGSGFTGIQKRLMERRARQVEALRRRKGMPTSMGGTNDFSIIPKYNQISPDDSLTVRKAKLEAQRKAGINIPSTVDNAETQKSVIAEPTKEVGKELKYDSFGNIIGMEIPKYNKITGTDSLMVIKAKKDAQMKLARNAGFAGGGFGADILGAIFNPTGIFGKMMPTAKTPTTTTSTTPAGKEVLEEVAPNGLHYEKNDVDYLIKKGYTKESAIAFLATSEKYTKVTPIPRRTPLADEEPEFAPNGRHYETNDVAYLLKRGYAREQALEILSKDPKYTQQLSGDPRKHAYNTPKVAEQPKQKKRRRKHGGFFGWIGGMLGINPVIEDKKEETPKVAEIPKTEVTESIFKDWKGGEYFNDPSKVTMVARTFVNGVGTLEEVAKSIGFDGIPSGDTPLTPEQQQMLGYMEYSKIRNWNHYLNDVSLWKNTGALPVDRWTTGVVDPFAGKGFAGGGIADGKVPSALETLNALRKKHGKSELLMGKDTRYVGSQQALANMQTPTVFNGITQASITSFTGGEYFNAEDKISPEAKAYVRGKGDLWDVAKSIGFNGLPPQNTPLTASMQQLLGYREYSPVRTWQNYLVDSEIWKRGGMTSAERWINAVAQKPAPSDQVNAPTVADTLTTGTTEVGKALEALKKAEDSRNRNESKDLFSKMVELLGSIATNTGGMADGIKGLGKQNPIILSNGRPKDNRNLFIQNLNTDKLDRKTLDAMSNPKASEEYQRQMQIAAGGEFVR